MQNVEHLSLAFVCVFMSRLIFSRGFCVLVFIFFLFIFLNLKFIFSVVFLAFWLLFQFFLDFFDINLCVCFDETIKKEHNIIDRLANNQEKRAISLG